MHKFRLSSTLHPFHMTWRLGTRASKKNRLDQYFKAHVEDEEKEKEKEKE